MSVEPRWSTPQKAADYMGLESRRPLQRLRDKGEGSVYSKRGTSFFHRVSDVDNWLEGGQTDSPERGAAEVPTQLRALAR